MVLVGALLASCSPRAEEHKSVAEVDASREGHVLPPYEAKDCVRSAGEISEEAPAGGFNAVISKRGDSGSSVVQDPVIVSVTESSSDRELADDEARETTTETLGDRTVRTQTQGAESSLDWYEDGWLVLVRFESASADVARTVAADLELPEREGSPDDVTVNVPSDAEVVAESGAAPLSGSYFVSGIGCESQGQKYTDANVMVTFFAGELDPRAYLGSAATTQRSTKEGVDYWVAPDRGRVVWVSGSAIVSLVSPARAENDLVTFASAMQRASAEDVEAWVSASGSSGADRSTP